MDTDSDSQYEDVECEDSETSPAISSKTTDEEGSDHVIHQGSEILNKASYNSLDKLTLTLIGNKIYDWDLNNSKKVQACDGILFDPSADKDSAKIAMLQGDRQAFRSACDRFDGQIEYEDEGNTFYDKKYCFKFNMTFTFTRFEMSMFHSFLLDLCTRIKRNQLRSAKARAQSKVSGSSSRKAESKRKKTDPSSGYLVIEFPMDMIVQLTARYIQATPLIDCNQPDLLFRFGGPLGGCIGVGPAGNKNVERRVHKYRLSNMIVGSFLNLKRMVGHLDVAFVHRDSKVVERFLKGDEANEMPPEQRRTFLSAMKGNCFALHFDFNKKMVLAYFYLDSLFRIHMVKINFKSIKSIFLDQTNGVRTSKMDREDGCHLVFDLQYAPNLCYAEIELNEWNFQKICEKLSGPRGLTGFLWKRELQFQFAGPGLGKKSGQSYPSNMVPLDEHALSLCRSYCFSMKRASFELFESLLYLTNVCKEMKTNIHFCLGQVEVSSSSPDLATPLGLTDTWVVDRSRPKTEPSSVFEWVRTTLGTSVSEFNVLYALLVLMGQSYKIIDLLRYDNSLKLLLNHIASQCNNQSENTDPCKLSKRCQAIEKCLYLLKSRCENSILVNVWSEYLHIFESRREWCQTLTLPSTGEHGGCVMMRRLNLTPSHIELCKPMALLGSRFSSSANVEYALRVQIMDDNGQRLNSVRGEADIELITERISHQLIRGISLGGRRYKLLGSSSSQLRENGLMLYAKDDQLRNAHEIRSSAGDLRKFRFDVAKYVSRLGLMFSQSLVQFTLMEKHPIYLIKDLHGEVKPPFKQYANFQQERHNFSDGVGLISRSLAKNIMKRSGIKVNVYEPSAFQIRLGGCKGMVVVHDFVKEGLCIRQSMMKYESPDCTLRVLKFSHPRPVFLNRPLINILDQIHVESRVFYSYFTENTDLVVASSFDDRAAVQLTQTYSLGQFQIEQLGRLGVHLLTEPFFREMINYLIKYRLNELKAKARIRVPYSKGRMAFGVVDETKTLTYGQVFFQYSVVDEYGRATGEVRLLEGEIMVTKFPCLQPGDVRKLTAVKCPLLKHIKDCIVFPANGARPHPDEMSGSDLDGDEYAVFWDSSLIPAGQNHKAMVFPYGRSKQQKYPITNDDIVQFYCKYLLENNIGRVANCHLMYSDVHPDGLFSDECVLLAEQYSIALDFQKTGYYENLSNEIQLNIRPDFMEKYTGGKIYLSRRILGQFYRHCSLMETIIELSNFDKLRDHHRRRKLRDSFYVHPSEATSGPHETVARQYLIEDALKMTDATAKFILKDWTDYSAQAEHALVRYKLNVVELLEQFDIDMEVVLLTDVYEDKQEVSRRLVDDLFNNFRAMFEVQCQELGIYYQAPDSSQEFEMKIRMSQRKQSSNGEDRDQRTLKTDEQIKKGKRSSKPNESLDAYWRSRYNQMKLASAWYAIVFDKVTTYRGRTLLGLPWLIGAEMAQLSLYHEYKTNKPKARSSEDGQPPLARPSKLYECSLSVAGASACVTSDDSLDHLLDTAPHYRVCRRLFGLWFATVDDHIYNDQSPAEATDLVIRDRREIVDGKSVPEDCPEQIDGKTPLEMSAAFVEEFLRDHARQTLKKFAEIQDVTSTGLPETKVFKLPLGRLSEMFNNFMRKCYQLCSRGNELLSKADLGKLFLLKYAVFSLKFINKFDDQLDDAFGELWASSKSSEHSPTQVNEIDVQTLLDALEPLFVSNISAMKEDIFRESSEFHLLFPKDKHEDKSQWSLIKKMVAEATRNSATGTRGSCWWMDNLRLLTGIDVVRINQSGSEVKIIHDSFIPPRDDHTESSSGDFVLPLTPSRPNDSLRAIADLAIFRVHAIGYKHSIRLLHLMMGHKHFLTSVLRNFDLVPREHLSETRVHSALVEGQI